MPPLISPFRIAAGVALLGILMAGTLVLTANNKAIGSPVQAAVDSTLGTIETDGTLDSSFNAGNFTNGSVAAAVLQPDGKLVIGGSFSQVHGVKRLDIARLNADGTLDSSFDSGDATASLGVEEMILQPDGKIIVLAAFTYNGLTRLNSDGSIDNDFGPSHSIPGGVYSVVLQPDGKIIAMGYFSCIITAPGTCVPRSCVARFNSDGSFDPTYNSGTGFLGLKGPPYVARGVRQSIGANSGKVIMEGYFALFDGHPAFDAVRLNTDGSFDDTFTPGYDIFWPGTSGLLAQSDDQIVVFGSGIVRLNSSGVLDSGFSTEAFDDYGDPGTIISAVAEQPDGKLVVVGNFHSLGGEPANNVVRLETSGTRDVTFSATAAGASANFVESVLVRPSDNKIFVGGDFSTYGGAPRGNIAWVNSDGSVDSTFSGLTGATDSFPRIYAVAVQADGKLLVGGFFSSFDGSPHYNLVRLNPDSTIDSSFDVTLGTDGSVRAFLIQPDGKIVIAGNIHAVNGVLCGRIARLNSDGTLDPTFAVGAGADSSIYALEQDLAGNIYVGGGFRSFDGLQRPFITKLNPTGAVDKTFNAGANFLSTVFAIAPPDGAGRIVIGDGARIARLDGTTGARDVGFNHGLQGFDSVVRTLTAAPDGKYYVGGDFSHFNGTPRSHVARVNNDGSLDATFDGPLIDGSVLTLALQNGKVFVGRDLTDPPGQVIRLTSSGALDSSFATGTSFGIAPPGTYSVSSPAISALTIQPDGKLLVGGTFNQYNGTSRICLARLTGPSIPTPTPSTLGNVSTLEQVGTGDNVLIGGFIVFGTQPKKVIVRAIGPSLPLGGVLSDPVLELRDATGALIASNDNWRSDQEAEIIATGIPPSNDLESAIVATLPAYGSAYTAIVRGVNNGTGIGVVEAYDLDRTVDSKLANISTRGFVQSGDNAMIGGFIVVTRPTRVIIRAIGPSLTQFGVPGALANPQLELHNATSIIARNDDWQTTQIGGIITSDQVAEIQNSQLAPTNPLESAIIATLAPGSYTAIMRGVNDTTGNALVEVYALQ
jgi:uncharacterized delta-60 repeat protein